MQLSNTYNTVANTLDQLQTTAILCTNKSCLTLMALG